MVLFIKEKMSITIKRLLPVMLLIVQTTQALIGYDCGGISMNVTTMSAVTVGECNIPLKNPREEAVTLQLLQLAEFRNTEVRECRVTNGRQEYSRTTESFPFSFLGTLHVPTT
ncbi:hypothetical protein KQX54_001808 [Cotesia glomerata]|uniref:Uncharacterized protein n=1 Tax=Cotesia glomerata TaxID=32391 RepID=A0AAV7HZX3_COTGL|nr:hypothetical protein KQX54_001808 [Cotesia glomerata]